MRAPGKRPGRVSPGPSRLVRRTRGPSLAPPCWAIFDRPLVIAAEAVPHVQLNALGRELDRPLVRQSREHGVERLVLGDPGLEGLLAAEARGDLQRLAPILAEA